MGLQGLFRRGSLPALIACLAVGLPLRAQKVPNEDLSLRVTAPSDGVLTGAEFDSAVILDSQVGGIEGWQFGIEHDPAMIELVDAKLGLTSLTANDGGEPEFVELNTTPAMGAGVTLGVVITINQSVTLPAGNDYELLELSYRVIGDPVTAEGCTEIVTSLEISENLGLPDTPVLPRVSIGGLSELPVLTNGDVTIRCPGTLEFTKCEGGLDSVDMEWSFSDDPNWELLLLYRDGDLLEILDADAMAYFDSNVAPGEHVYTLAALIVEGGADPVLIFSKCRTVVNPVTIDTLDPGLGTWLGGELLTLTGTAFTVPESISVILFGPGTVVLEVEEIVSDTELSLRTTEAPALGVYSLRITHDFGESELTDVFEYGFVRGEVNSDGMIDMSDSIHLLEYIFLGTQDEPRCLDSADANDDGKIDITDAVVLLWYSFVDGDLAPSAPFPEAGQDPTDDNLDCI